MMRKIEEGATRWLALGVVAFVLQFSAGCAMTPEARAKYAPGAVQVSPGQGLVALKITGNRPGVSTFFGKWATLRVQNLSTKETFALSDRSDSSAPHSLFVEALPAGTYSIDAVGNQASGWLTITEGARARGTFPTFKIADGHITNLGTLAYIRNHYPVDTAQFQWGELESPFDQTSIVRQLEPSLASRLSKRTVLGWDEGNQLRERQAAVEASRHNTLRVLAPTPLADGSFLFGESFGQIAMRSRAGDWRWLQTPAALPIRAIYVDDGGVIFAGSDDAVFLSGHVGGGSWESIALPVNDASVIYIGAMPNTAEELLVVLQTRDRFIGLSTSKRKPGQWTEQFSRPRALFSNPTLDANGVVLKSGENLVVAAGSVEAKLEVVTYDKNKRAWKATALNESGSPLSWVSLGDGSIGHFGGIPLTGMYFTVSNDSGVTWERRGDLNWANNSLLFVSNKIGYVVRTDSTPALDPEKFELSLWRTDDGGRNWKKVGRTPTIHGKLIPLQGTEGLGYASVNGKFFVSSDGGRSWRLERQIP